MPSLATIAPITASTPVAFADPLPAEVDVLVIGGGVIGVATAYFLARAGISVLLCEKGRVAGEQSSRNWGWVRQQGRDPAELPIMMEANRIWRGLAAATGEEFGFTQHGCLYLAESDAELARFEPWLEVARAHQLDTRLIGAAELAGLVPELAGSWWGALYTASDGRAEPALAVPALARAAQGAGARIAEACAVRSLDLAAGRVAGVVTERGRVRAGAVVLAAGAWSWLFAGNHGLELPQLTVKATVARTAAAPIAFPGNAAADDIAFRRRRDGGYSVALSDFHEHFVSPRTLALGRRFLPGLRSSWRDLALRPGPPAGQPDAWGAARRWRADEVSPFERLRVLDPAPSRKALRAIGPRLARRLPALAETPLVQAWAGMIDVMPDVVPVIDRAATPAGLYLATGFSGHGFGIGPAAGRVVADLVQDRAPGHDLSRFRLTRFSDGTPLELDPAL